MFSFHQRDIDGRGLFFIRIFCWRSGRGAWRSWSNVRCGALWIRPGGWRSHSGDGIGLFDCRRETWQIALLERNLIYRFWRALPGQAFFFAGLLTRFVFFPFLDALLLVQGDSLVGLSFLILLNVFANVIVFALGGDPFG